MFFFPMHQNLPQQSQIFMCMIFFWGWHRWIQRKIPFFIPVRGCFWICKIHFLCIHVVYVQIFFVLLILLRNLDSVHTKKEWEMRLELLHAIFIFILSTTIREKKKSFFILFDFFYISQLCRGYFWCGTFMMLVSQYDTQTWLVYRFTALSL